MTWIEPKEDWEMGDAPSNGDFNRIEGNIKHIMDLKGVANGLATLNGNKKIPMAELLAGVAGGLATLGSNGKVPQEQLPAAVEIKTIRIPKTSIPVGGNITKTATFDYYHKAAIVVAIASSSLTGFVGAIINASEGISNIPGIFSVTEYSGGDTKTYIGGSSFNGNIFGSKIGFQLSFSNKTVTFALKNDEGSSAYEGGAAVNIIAL